ncbi:DUF4136 domain-containing protein [Endozoicomonas sp. SCSIO W0465]|uniref:DUF4136 domain-containing protein n=1 Tax=Endozoicomonas sp. SCSIO W0465 TaxID=2918516 RepID=UPI002075AD70|nr:DUF4136 domain-containing protein [Endozoicomonas sp. SCSIO W0465]USE34516.1 DUF4136 domain-containing protein [Endozoicomonas sp. SCSIO W0465]
MSMVRKIPGTVVVLLTVILAGCASRNVDWDYDTERSLTGMTVYRWIEPALDDRVKSQKPGYHVEALMDQRVHNAVNSILATRGFQRVDSDKTDVDFLVNYITSRKTRREERQVTTSFGYGFSPWGLGFSTDSRVQEYEEGSLIIDIIDPETRQVIWRGRSRARIQENLSPEQRTVRINEAVASILEGFPRPEK